MSTRHLRYVFSPRSVVLIGASERLGSIRAALTQTLLAGGFKGDLFLVNRHPQQIKDRYVYPQVAALPIVPELAIVATPIRTIPKLLVQLARRGTRVALISIDAVPKASKKAVAFYRTLQKITQTYDLRLLGVDQSGLVIPGLGLNVSLSPIPFRRGSLAFITQSETLLTPMLAWGAAHSIGFSHLITIGQRSEISIEDCLDWLANQPEVQGILLYLDTVSSARAFLSAARAVARMKPLVVFRPHRGRNQAFSQLDAVFDAAFQRIGAWRVQSLDALWIAAQSLGYGLSVTGDRLLIVGNGSDLGSVAATALTAAGGRLAPLNRENTLALEPLIPTGIDPENPLNLGRDAGPERFTAALTILLRQSHINGLLIWYAPNVLHDPDTVAKAISTAVKQFREQSGEQPCVLVCWLGQDCNHSIRQQFFEQRIPMFDSPEHAIRVFAQRWRYLRDRIGLMATPPPAADFFAPDPTIARQMLQKILAAGRHILNRSEIATLLDRYGIVTTPEPVSEPVLLELKIQMSIAPIFGPVLTLATQNDINERCVLLPPLNTVLAREALKSTLIYQTLSQAEVGSHRLVEPLILLLTQVAQLIVDLGEVIALELSPIQISTTGLIVRAAEMRLAPSADSAEKRLAIRPYPRALEETFALPDGSTLLIRPVRADDEPAFVSSFAQLSTEEVRMRFMYTIKELVHEEAARLTQIDYEREMALVVFRQRPDQPLESCGVARLMRDPDGERAEFAIVLLRAATGIGLGSLLVRRLIRYARARGFRALFGEILRENEAMLALCRAMGFGITVCPEDTGVMIATLPLT